MYFMVDAVGTVLAVNPFGAEMLGYRVDELVGQPVLSVCYESDREAVQRHVAQCLRQLGRANSWEARKVRKDGTVLWVRETAKAVPRANGPIVLIACEDMTEQRRAADALRQAQADLAHVSRVTTLGEMAASIAHEVDQPLSGVVINANACLRFLTSASPNLDEVRDGLQAIARDGRRAGDVIARIRLLARRTTIEKEPLDINDVIREVVALAEGEAHRTRARLRTELAGDLPRVVGDPVQLQQVVLNLLLNGLDAMHAVMDARASWSSARNGKRPIASGSRCRTRDPASTRSWRTASSRRSTPRSAVGWGWACRSAGRLSSSTADDSGRCRTTVPARRSISRCKATTPTTLDATGRAPASGSHSGTERYPERLQVLPFAGPSQLWSLRDRC